MPSWNEKPVEVPTINVNLAPCDRHHLPLDKTDPAYHVLPGTGNLARCESPPILIPCHIPRSVTFMVTLGKCDGRCATWATASAPYGKGPDGSHHVHHDRCPARPIRVSCSISGKTWEESEVADIEPRTDKDGDDWGDAMWRACSDRWEIVKALVTGKRALAVMDIGWEVNDHLISQRDAVFSALADMARAEEMHNESKERALKAAGLRPRTTLSVGDAGRGLADFVERLTDQVSVLEGA